VRLPPVANKGKKDKDKNKNVVPFMEERLREINTSMFALIGRTDDDMYKRIEELEYAGHMKKLHGKIQEVENPR